MVRLTFIFGGLLVLLGIGFYVATGMDQTTALIPAGFGVLLLICAWLGTLGAGWRKHAMHAALLIALLGAVATGVMVLRAPAMTVAVWEQLIMALLCLIFVGLGIKSFIDARRNRQVA